MSVLKNGLHINEDHFVAEIIDPATGEMLPDGSLANWSDKHYQGSLAGHSLPHPRYHLPQP